MYPCSVFREVPAARRPRQLPQLLVVVRSAANNRTQLQFQSGEQLAPAPAARSIHPRHGSRTPRTPGWHQGSSPRHRDPQPPPASASLTMDEESVSACQHPQACTTAAAAPPSCAVNNHCNYTIGHTDHTLDLIQLQNWIICSLAK